MTDEQDPSPRVPSGSTQLDDLQTALGHGDPEIVRALINSGADIHYKREGGYDALLDAVHGRDIYRDLRLLELLTLLISHEVNLSGVSSYGESGLRVLSRVGRFDAVGLLLDAGADRSQLQWNPLMEAVALGTLADVKTAIEQGTPLESRDWWQRTPWLIAVLTGDIAKAKLLQAWGANRAACGICDCPPLFFAIQGHHADMLDWLLQSGASVNQSDKFGTTSLIEAVEQNDVPCVDILLNAGADVNVHVNGSTLSRAHSREMVMRLLEAGADPADADQRVILGLAETGDEALATITLEEFQRSFSCRFGSTNPERMSVPFWGAMIRCGASAYDARSRFDAPPQYEDICGGCTNPVWCAQRFGQSLTLLPDGRAVQIGGEHEDFYDPDFCIYNDVFFHDPDGSVEVYGYPESVFPPTDFHTATLVGDSIYVIGSLGYREKRRYGQTPVYRLDLRSKQMEQLHVSGESPGWIFKHRAILVSPRAIRIWGGTIITRIGDAESQEENLGSFVLDLERLHWLRE